MEKLKKGLWLLGITTLAAVLTWAMFTLFAAVAHAEPTKVVYKTYTVVEGDTLSTIADKYGTTWRNLWELNPQITDPNLIYIDQVIMIQGKPTKVVQAPKVLTPDEFKTKITELMFKEAVLENEDPIDLLLQIRDTAGNIWAMAKEGNYAGIRRTITKLCTITRKAEIHALAEAITSVYEKDKERAYVLVALAWQESHFVNRRGKAGEVGFYQFMPSTVRSIFGKDLFDLKLREIEDDPAKATEFADWYLTQLMKQYGSIKNALYRYNGHPEYAGYVLNKLTKVKQFLR